MFPVQSKSSSNEPGVTTVPCGKQNEDWGSPIVLHGQLGSVCVFHDVITPSQIKALYTAGTYGFAFFEKLMSGITITTFCVG